MTTDNNRFVEIDMEDPRVKCGPCKGKFAHKPLTSKQLFHWHAKGLIELSYNGNQYGRWVDCPRCGVRMG